jgi:ribosome modulation factor
MREISAPPYVYRAGWRAALSGIERRACPHTDDVHRRAWNEGYTDAERERAKDVADVRGAVSAMNQDGGPA